MAFFTAYLFVFNAQSPYRQETVFHTVRWKYCSPLCRI